MLTKTIRCPSGSTSCPLAALAVCGLLAGQAAAAESYLLSFSGTIDGSDTITIAGNTAQWQHNYWDFPSGAVMLDGQPWQPQTNTQLVFGSPQVPASLDGYAIRVRRFQGRDVETAERQGNSLVLRLDDTPDGAAPYQYNIALIPEVPAPSSPPATLRITGTIDGSDEVVVDASGATWSHFYWGNPGQVTLNGVNWSPTNGSVLPNSGATRFLPSGVSFQNVTIHKNSGRDVAGLDTRGDQVAVYFADNPIGADFYDVTLTFSGSPLAAPLPGDANCDGKVDFTDLVTMARHYRMTGATWTEGDFDLDGKVDFADLVLLARNYGQTLTGSQLGQLDPAFRADVEKAFAEVPEPACLPLVSLAVAVLARRRPGLEKRILA